MLPPELLSAIFTEYLAPEPTRTRLPRFAARFPCVPQTAADPFVLGQVCSYWRGVASNTPALWTRMVLKRPKMSHLARARLWLERAAPLGCNVLLDGSDVPGREELNASRILLCMLLDQCADVPRGLEIYGSSRIFEGVAFGSGASRLTSALIHVSDLEEVVGAQETLDSVWEWLHTTAPLLKSADWGTLYGDHLPSHAPWSQLEAVRIEAPVDLEELFNILPQCTQAKSIHINNLSEPLPSFEPPTSSLRLANLENLHVVMSQPSSDLFFQGLTLPKLEELSVLHYDPEESRRYPQAFREFMERSGCVLHSFKFMDECLNEDDLIGWLDAPGTYDVRVLGLDIRGSVISQRLLDRLVRSDKPDGKKELLPHLESMEVAVCDFPEGRLAKLIRSRQGELSFVSVMMASDVEGYFLEDVKAIRDLCTDDDSRMAIWDLETGQPRILTT